MSGGDPGRDGTTELDPGAWSLRDEAVRRYVRDATAEVESLVRTTLGPRGMEKLIRTQDSKGRPELVQTADAGEVMAALERADGGITHPVAALFLDHVDSLQRGLNDGATTAIVLAAALVDRGLALAAEGLAPANVVIGYAMAATRAGELLDELAREASTDDGTLLRQVAATSMTATDLPDDARERYAARVAEAVRGLAAASEDRWLDTDDVKVLARTAVDEQLHRGLVIRRWPGPADENESAAVEFDSRLAFPERTADVTVALIDHEIQFGETASVLSKQGHTGTRLSPEEAGEYAAARRRRAAAVAERFAGLGVDVLVSQERIDHPTTTAFQRAGVAVIDGAKYPRSDVFRLARATGATVERDVDDVTADSLGTAGSVEEYWVDEERWTVFDGCEGGVFTLVVDAGAAVAAEERERVVADAVEVAATAAIDRQVLPGAGAPAVAAAAALDDYATAVPERSQLAVEAFAEALEAPVRALARNAGHDPVDALPALRAAHARAEADPAPIGLDSDTGQPVDAWAVGVVEPRRVFSRAVETARAAAEQLLTVDAVLFPGVDFGSYEPVTEHE